MQPVSVPRLASPRVLAAIMGRAVVATLLVAVGLAAGYAAFATPLLSQAVPAGRPDGMQLVAGMALWAAALVAPAGSILVGVHRLARDLAAVRAQGRHRSPLVRALGDLPQDTLAASGLVLPDGRTVSDLVVGPFGAAVIRELPPADLTRVRAGRWELRTTRGWMPLESPLDRAARDAERVRRWFGHDDTDFVVKVYAAVVGPDPVIERTAACAVLTPDRLGPWIAALPVQRSLTEGRRERMVEQVRSAVQ
ncbi:MAG: hypothetical protein ACLGIJ_02180 [Candidatus Limnocylindria bacterium]